MALWMVKEHRETVYVKPITNLEKGLLEVQQNCQQNYRGWFPPIDAGDCKIHASSYNMKEGVELSILECDLQYFKDRYLQEELKIEGLV